MPFERAHMRVVAQIKTQKSIYVLLLKNVILLLNNA